MVGEWRASTWGEEITLKYGKALRDYDIAQGRYRVFGSNGPIGWANEPLALGPGVILGRKGAYRGVQYSHQPFFVIDTAYYVVPKSELDMRWLYYAVKHYKLGDIDDGSPIPSTTRAAVYMVDLDVPPLSEQRAIARILGTLDDKIELNRRMIETLEAMAQALFGSWVDDHERNRVDVAELVRVGALEIGDGYRAKNSELGCTGLPFIRAGNLGEEIDTGRATRLCEESIRRVGSKLSRPGDVAFTSKGTIGRFARVTEFTQPFVYSPQVCFWRSLDASRLSPAILYCWMLSSDLRSQIDAVAGQTDMAPYVSLRDQRAMMVPDFGHVEIDMHRRLDVLLMRQARAFEERRVLGELRDLLLPKLLKGELRV